MSDLNVDEIRDSAGTGAPDFPNGFTNSGTAGKNKWQRKDLTTNKTTTQSPLTELSFSGLTVGKTYRMAVYGVVSAGSTSARSEYYIQHNGVDITRAREDRDSTTTARGLLQSEVIFTATTTTVNVRWVVVSGTITLEGTLANTCYSILEELNNYTTETTDFT